MLNRPVHHILVPHNGIQPQQLQLLVEPIDERNVLFLHYFSLYQVYTMLRARDWERVFGC
jgi:hypothetical protein